MAHLGNEIRLLREAINKQTSAIADNTQSQNQQQKTPPEITAELHSPQPIDVNTHSDDKGHPRRDKIRLVIEGLGLAGAIVIVIFAFRTLKETRKQALAVQGQLLVMQAGQRPWIGLGSDIVIAPHEPTVRLIGLPGIKSSLNYSLSPRFLVKNFGTSPAFGVNTSINVVLPMPPKDTVTPPKVWDCPDASTKQGKGEVIFPNTAGTVQGTYITAGVPDFEKYVPEVARVWIVGCISYQSGSDAKIHHTKFWFRSAHPDNAQWTTVIGGGKFRYLPITGFESWGAEAD